MTSSSLLEALNQQRSNIERIRQVSGAPGLAIGIVQSGEVRFESYHGHRDPQKHQSMNQDTIFNIASLAKSITAAAIGLLVHDGKLKWSTPIHDILSEMSHDSPLYEAKINVIDIMSHATGVAASEALYMQGNNCPLSTKDESISIFEAIPIVAPARTTFLYNNQAWNLLGLVIERLSGQSYGTFIQSRIFNPLNMTRSSTEHINDSNIAFPHSILLDKTPYRIPFSSVGGNTTMFAGQSIRSSLGDLLRFYAAYLASLPGKDGSPPCPYSPLKELSTIIRARTVLPTAPHSLREQSHACAMNRTQLPGPMSFGWNRRFVKQLPLLGQNSSNHSGALLLWLNGYMPGVTTKVCMLPELDIGIVVLQNSLGLTDAADWVASLLVDTILGGEPGYDYVALAKEAVVPWGKRMDEVASTLASERILNTKPRVWIEYVGKYWNVCRNWVIEVGLTVGEDGLWMRMQGKEEEEYALTHYHHDTFTWNMSYDDTVKRGQFCKPVEYWKIMFEVDRNCGRLEGKVGSLRWQHDPLVTCGEVFTKA